MSLAATWTLESAVATYAVGAGAACPMGVVRRILWMKSPTALSLRIFSGSMLRLTLLVIANTSPTLRGPSTATEAAERSPHSGPSISHVVPCLHDRLLVVREKEALKLMGGAATPGCGSPRSPAEVSADQAPSPSMACAA